MNKIHVSMENGTSYIEAFSGLLSHVNNLIEVAPESERESLRATVREVFAERVQAKAEFGFGVHH